MHGAKGKKSHLFSECLNKGTSYLPVLWSFSQYREIVSPEQADLACFSPCPLSVWQWHQHMHYMTVQGTGIVVSTCLFVVLSFTVFKSIGQIQFLYCCHIQMEINLKLIKVSNSRTNSFTSIWLFLRIILWQMNLYFIGSAEHNLLKSLDCWQNFIVFFLYKFFTDTLDMPSFCLSNSSWLDL